MWVVASDTADPAVVLVTLALKNPVRLETKIVDFASLRHRKYFVHAAVTGTTKLLGQQVARQDSRIENLFCLHAPAPHCSNVPLAGSVTGFTPDPGYKLVQLQLRPADSAGSVTAETITRVVVRHLAAECFVQGSGRHVSRPKSKIESADLSIETNPAFVVRAVVENHVGLARVPLPECVNNRLGNLVAPVRNGIDALIPRARNFVNISSAPERQVRVRAQHCAIAAQFQGPRHAGRP